MNIKKNKGQTNKLYVLFTHISIVTKTDTVILNLYEILEFVKFFIANRNYFYESQAVAYQGHNVSAPRGINESQRNFALYI